MKTNICYNTWEASGVQDLTLNDVMGTHCAKNVDIQVIRISTGPKWCQIRFYYSGEREPIKRKFWKSTVFILGEKSC